MVEALAILDEVGMLQPGAYLSMAIDALERRVREETAG
jgi:hypothetical protein